MESYTDTSYNIAVNDYLLVISYENTTNSPNRTTYLL